MKKAKQLMAKTKAALLATAFLLSLAACAQQTPLGINSADEQKAVSEIDAIDMEGRLILGTDYSQAGE